MLVEMIAVDRARRIADDATLASAIVLVSGDLSHGSSGERPQTRLEPLPEGRSDIQARVARLLDGVAPLATAAWSLVWIAAVALVAVPTVLLFAPVVLEGPAPL